MIPFAMPSFGRGAAAGGGGGGGAPFGTHTYWKFISRANNSGGFTTMTKLQPTDGAGTDISAAGATITGSATQAGALANLVDGDDTNASFWQTAVLVDAEVKFQFASPAGVGGFKIAPFSTALDRAPSWFDVYYSDDDSAYTYAFSGAYSAWSGNTVVTFVDPGAGAQTDWIVRPTAVNGAAGWFNSEIQWRATVGGADAATGGTAISGRGFDFNAVALLFDDDTDTFAGSTNIATFPYVWGGYQLSSAIDIAQMALISRSTTSQAMTAGEIYAGANNAFRSRKTFSGLTIGAHPDTQTVTI